MEEAVLDMCIGEKRRLIVPPELGRREFDNTLDNGLYGIDCFDKNSNLSKEEISILYLEETCYPGKEELQGWIWFLEEIFSKKDKDKNGYISHEEFSGSKHDEL